MPSGPVHGQTWSTMNSERTSNKLLDIKNDSSEITGDSAKVSREINRNRVSPFH